MNTNVIQGAVFAAIQAFVECLKNVAENSITSGTQWDLGWRPPSPYDIRVLQYNLIGHEHSVGKTTIRQYRIGTNLMTANVWVARSNPNMPWLPVFASHEGLGPNPPFWHIYDETTIAFCPKCYNKQQASCFQHASEHASTAHFCTCGEEMEVWPGPLTTT